MKGLLKIINIFSLVALVLFSFGWLTPAFADYHCGPGEQLVNTNQCFNPNNGITSPAIQTSIPNPSGINQTTGASESPTIQATATCPAGTAKSSDLHGAAKCKDNTTGNLTDPNYSCNPPYGLDTSTNPPLCQYVGNSSGCAPGYSQQTQNGQTTCVPVSGSQNTVHTYEAQIKIPCRPIAGGNCPSAATPAGYVAQLYQFGLMIAGFVAFGSIVYGALKKVLAAGNIAGQQDANEQITSAIWGLVLLLGAYLILHTINPSLVSLSNPSISVLDITDLTSNSTAPTGNNQSVFTGGTGGNQTVTNPEAQNNCQFGTTVQVGVSGSVPGVSGNQVKFVCLSCASGYQKDDNGICQWSAAAQQPFVSTPPPPTNLQPVPVP